jgi:hypothetical protein
VSFVLFCGLQFLVLSKNLVEINRLTMRKIWQKYVTTFNCAKFEKNGYVQKFIV